MKRKLSIFILALVLISSLKLKAQEHGRSDTLDVIHYDINLSIVDFTNKTISGFTTIKTAFKLPNISIINFDLLALDVDSIYLNDVKHTAYLYSDSLISINLTTPANTSDTLVFKIFYHGAPIVDGSNWGGFYFSGNYAFNLGVGFQSIPHCFGRVWFPCIDEFKDRALYDFNITTPDTMMAVCGGTLLGSVTNLNNTKTWHWRLSSPIPTYLASVAVGNYVGVNIPLTHGTDVTQAYIYVPPSDTTKARNSFLHLNDIFNSYINHWGPYQWERVGFTGVPFNSGAMEHATNISYPTFAIDGTLNYESLYAHELSHHWFGDLITCSSAEDMWINEGWARYCEGIIKGDLYPNSNPMLDGYKVFIRDLQYKFFRGTYADDGGYFPLSPMPQNITYGTTTYDKGGLIAHTLRYYLGDTIFFNSVKQVMQEFTYKPINSAQFCDRLSFYSGVDLHDFFNAWVYQPGNLHFSVDSIVPVQGQPNKYTYYIHQKQSLGHNLGNSNRIEVAFFDSNWNAYIDTIHFSGEFGNKITSIPFTPVFSAIDYNEHMADAIVDYNLKIKVTGTNSCPYAFATLNTDAITDSAFVRVEHHWAKPDEIKHPSTSISRLSPNRYWKIDGIIPSNFQTRVNFNYNIATDLDGNLFTSGNADSLVVVYRRNASEDWTLVPFVKAGTTTGIMKVTSLQMGEYALAIGDKNQVGIQENNNVNKYIQVSPNPSNGKISINVNSNEISAIEIIDSSGKLVKKFSIEGSNIEIVFTLSGAGIYFIRAKSKDNKICETHKVIITN